MNKDSKHQRRKKRVRAKVSGTSKRPRVSVYRSNKYIYAQLIDDEKGKTVVSVASMELSTKKGKTRMESATEVGKKLAEKAKEKKVTSVVFDRGGYKYHGRVKALAEGAREGGLKF